MLLYLPRGWRLSSIQKRAWVESGVRAASRFLRENALFLLLLGFLAIAYLWLRQGPSSLATADEFDALLGTGRPVLVEFYSDT
jgi:hypothetical protein